MDERLEQGSRGTPARRKLQRHRSTAAEDEENSDGVEEEARQPKSASLHFSTQHP